MVEVDVQFLVGVAVTVYIALLFFGVIVLWDISLALRGVGEKIDKLEDNIDDDLTDIGYALDGMSNGPGGGGTQLHLSGGTISSGPQGPEGGIQHTPSQAHQPQEAYGPQPGTDARYPHRESPAAPPEGESEPQIDDDEPDETIDGEQDGPGDDEQDGPDDDEQDESDDEASDEDDERVTDEGPDEELVGEDGDEDAETDVGDHDDGDAPSEYASRQAARNRGRFVTSPDRTPWYGTALDREAIVAAKEPTIAGELEAPGANPEDDEPEVIVVGPATDESAEEERSAVHPVDADASVSEESDARVSESVDGFVTGDENDGEIDDGRDATGIDGEALSYDESNLERAADTVDEVSSEEDEVSSEEDEVTDEEDEVTDGEVDEPEARLDDGVETARDRSDDEDESVGANAAAFDNDVESDGIESERDEGDEDQIEQDDEEFGGDDEESRDQFGDDDPAADDAQSEPELDDVESDPFEFVEEDSDEMPSADDAAQQLNDEAPALSLSSHGFELTANVDDESAVLVFEFDPETVDISGSTKRLLTYQLSSYADQESSPDGDVTIERNSIVVEIPDADGIAIEDWANAAVDIIDRTLYLSDNR